HTGKCGKVGVTSTNGDLKGFIDQNQSPTKGNISVITLPVSSTNSPTKILPKTLGPINVNVGPQMVIPTHYHFLLKALVFYNHP
uniref:Uncharacterized protein n=1 Tax=Pavo cristatus TaxID=9049 RepID=A0A8C9LE28_PAVCR